MDKKLYYNELYDYYKDLLTEKQQEYYENYYFQDYSLSEIAENEQVSRNAVHGQLKIVLERLDFYEETLHLYSRINKLKQIIKNLDEDLQKQIEDCMEF